jgi:hypothetical protein
LALAGWAALHHAPPNPARYQSRVRVPP